MMRSKTKGLVAGLVAVAALAMMAPAAQAATPAPGFGQFANCPSPAENPAVVACVTSTVTSGNFKMGNKDVPITNPMTLSGGVDGNGNVLKGPKGPILTPVKQKVPGGVVGLTGLTWLLELLGSDALTLYAVTETAGTVNIGEFALTLPVKVRLVNPTLGNNCYVGSNSNPINLALTVGTTNPPPPNKPITGKVAEYTVENGVVKGVNGVLVDNSFSAPGATGCVLTLFGFIPISINGLVNAQAGLPSPAGYNETKQTVDQELAPVELVYP